MTLQEKVDRDWPLNKSEVKRAFGYSWEAQRVMRFPYVQGKIRPSEVNRHRAKMVDEAYAKMAPGATRFTRAPASPGPPPDIRALEAKLEHWKQDHARRRKDV